MYQTGCCLLLCIISVLRHVRRCKNLTHNTKNKLCGRPPQYAPPLQQKRAAAALSQAGRAGPDEPIRAITADRPAAHAAGRPMYATDVVRQTSDTHHHWGAGA